MVLTDELESKIYAFGARSDENIHDIQTKIKALGAVEKRKMNFFFLCLYIKSRLNLGVKIYKERFTDVNFDELHIENCKVILCNPPDSRSALIQPLDFLYNEGEGIIIISQTDLSFFFSYRYFSIETIFSTNRK